MDRRVKQLHYDVVYLSHSCQVAEAAPPLEVLLNGFDCILTHDKLRAQPREDYEDAAEAQSALQPALEASSATTELIDMCPIAFEPAGYHYEPIPPPEGQTVYAESIVAFDYATVSEGFVVTRDQFPAPRDDIQVERPVAAQLRLRWRQIVLEKESPTAVAYFVLTTLKEHYHGYQRAAQALNVSLNILETLSSITAIYDPVHGRKASKRIGTITAEQLHWV
jgi:hypothetical protein